MRDHFSEAEQQVLKILGRKKMTIQDIAEDFYHDGDSHHEIVDPGNYIANVVRRIKRKCEFFKLDWTIDGVGRGRGGRTVWRSKRGG